MFQTPRSVLLLAGLLLLARPVWAQTRVACVGDSITEGYGLNSPQEDAYPAELQRLLGSSYDVQNFGVSGSTAQKAGDRPYWSEPRFDQSTAFMPEVVLLMLGTNDVKLQNWNEARFQGDYIALVENYQQLGARVFVATPPKVFGAGDFGIAADAVNEGLVPLVRQLAEAEVWPLIDVFAATRDHPEWFSDLIHPTREGADAIAATFAEALTRQEPEPLPSSPAPNGSVDSSETSSSETSVPSSGDSGPLDETSGPRPEPTAPTVPSPMGPSGGPSDATSTTSSMRDPSTTSPSVPPGPVTQVSPAATQPSVTQTTGTQPSATQPVPSEPAGSSSPGLTGSRESSRSGCAFVGVSPQGHYWSTLTFIALAAVFARRSGARTS